MPRFCVNTNAQPTGEHEVHDLDAGCSRLPAIEHQLILGSHMDCRGAVARARQRYPQADGCHYCAPASHQK